MDTQGDLSGAGKHWDTVGASIAGLIQHWPMVCFWIEGQQQKFHEPHAIRIIVLSDPSPCLPRLPCTRGLPRLRGIFYVSPAPDEAVIDQVNARHGCKLKAWKIQ